MHLSEEGKSLIDSILSIHNKKRTDFSINFYFTPEALIGTGEQYIKITPYYLLGLTEGEGSFTYLLKKKWTIKFFIKLNRVTIAFNEGYKVVY